MLAESRPLFLLRQTNALVITNGDFRTVLATVYSSIAPGRPSGRGGALYTTAL